MKYQIEVERVVRFLTVVTVDSPEPLDRDTLESYALDVVSPPAGTTITREDEQDETEDPYGTPEIRRVFRVWLDHELLNEAQQAYRDEDLTAAVPCDSCGQPANTFDGSTHLCDACFIARLH